MKIQITTTNHMEYHYKWDKNLDEYFDMILYSDSKNCLLTEENEYVMIGQIVSHKEIIDEN